MIEARAGGADGQPDIEPLVAVAERHGVEITGPAPWAANAGGRPRIRAEGRAPDQKERRMEHR